MNVILFGPPGAGKGTQAKYLVKKLNGFQISTGDILRDEIKKDTEVGKQIIQNMNDGKFVDDQIVNNLIRNYIFDPQKKNKLIFDGYPRSLSQAKNLDLLLKDSNQKINQAGVIPAIFASALLLLPVTFSNFNFSDNDTFLNISSYFTQGQPLYMLLYASGIIFFTFFYTSITFNPVETADNLRKYGGFIPGIRPGESTALYIENILTKLTTIGALYLTLVCLMPEFLIAKYPIPFYLGGTSILIVVVVAIDTVTQIQTRLMSSQYEQLIKKTKFGK